MYSQTVCGLRIPLSMFLLQLCEGYGCVLARQLTLNVLTILNAFIMSIYFVGVSSFLEVFSQLYKLSRPRIQFLFLLVPLETRLEFGNTVKLGCFPECRDSIVS